MLDATDPTEAKTETASSTDTNDAIDAEPADTVVEDGRTSKIFEEFRSEADPNSSRSGSAPPALADEVTADTASKVDTLSTEQATEPAPRAAAGDATPDPVAKTATPAVKRDAPAPSDTTTSASPEPDPPAPKPEPEPGPAVAPWGPEPEPGPPAPEPEPGPPAPEPEPGPPAPEPKPGPPAPEPKPGPPAAEPEPEPGRAVAPWGAEPEPAVAPWGAERTVPTAHPPVSTPAGPARTRTEPEDVLSAYPWRLCPKTLRELADDPDPLRVVRDRLTDKLEYAERAAVRARLLSLRAVASRALGDLDPALADAREALDHAEATTDLHLTALVRTRLAVVLQWRGEYAEADRRYAEADSAELPDVLRAAIAELAARCRFEQGRHLEACTLFERALDLRRVEDPELVARVELALDVVHTRVRESGWGPYARTAEQVRQQPPRPHRAQDHESGLWGYADSDGTLVVPQRYADVAPFHDGLAWVRLPSGRAWELIDTAGTTVIDESAGYRGVGPFGDGLAWVTRDGTGGWFAIDSRNRVVVEGGFDDVRAFRNGLAPVRRGVGWGAVDRDGRLVVQPKYLGFATALAGGRHLDGFTDEGLAVVDAGNRKGVVDRGGREVVPAVHAALLIHPTAFVVGDRDGRWGALDRQGEPLVELTHPNPAAALDEVARRQVDIRPVL
ncbi:WG repeat-containing protein [Krasilnikovia cinnamomea]|uniref:WG repeat-containing protein n=1 Tax=Krasilnikovia cinnamomea TaxID=349313 RepID=UPI0013EF42B9|nr:WG repeat-containing protein [Krasilnikovia cinnamomea]